MAFRSLALSHVTETAELTSGANRLLYSAVAHLECA
jgi:hypothetical protein